METVAQELGPQEQLEPRLAASGDQALLRWRWERQTRVSPAGECGMTRRGDCGGGGGCGVCDAVDGCAGRGRARGGDASVDKAGSPRLKSGQVLFRRVRRDAAWRWRRWRLRCGRRSVGMRGTCTSERRRRARRQGRSPSAIAICCSPTSECSAALLGDGGGGVSDAVEGCARRGGTRGRDASVDDAGRPSTIALSALCSSCLVA
ncbi:hypothetical protein T484DRAFT_1932920 [Baffinella frigidus]|nr:hypothetical protein T484DRAFT_1932920 [Cryptophyta sp. CCMP2293]